MKKFFLCAFCLAVAWSAQSQGIIFFPGPSFYIPPNTDPVSLDMNADGISDVSFSAEFLETLDYPSSAASLICTVSPDNGAQLLATNSYAQILTDGQKIGGSPSWNSSDLLLTTTTWNLKNGTSSGWSGPLGAIGAGYLGIQFLAADGIHYGWIQVSLTNSDGLPFSPQIVDWAYETSPNSPIKAGQISKPISFTANLAGANEVPPNKSANSGTGAFTLESFVEGYVLTYHLELDGSFQPASAGIFGPATPNMISRNLIADLDNAQIVFQSPPIPVGPVPFAPARADLHRPVTILPPPSILVYDGQITLSSNQVTQLMRGQFYVNLKSARFWQGELRGEILPAAPVFFSATLSGRNQIPRNNSAQRGEAAFALTGATLAWEVALNANLAAASVGIYNSPSLFPFPFNLVAKLNTQLGVQVPAGGFPDAPGLPGQVLYSGQLTLTDEQVSQLNRGRFYLEVVTPHFRNGEIGGRIVPDQ